MSAQASAPAAAPVRIGCSGWIYQHWRGLFYPEKLAVKRWFEFYAGEFDTVGMKRTPFMMRKRCAPWYGRRCDDLRTLA
jgi:uncharacterized protein YecE (DUF72 family)